MACAGCLIQFGLVGLYVYKQLCLLMSIHIYVYVCIIIHSHTYVSVWIELCMVSSLVQLDT